jgi:DHA1 family bicyclomycin/chloramphenicol resistance-like MFS transporter
VFLIGYAIGQFFGGAFSDQIGRKRVGYSGLVVYLVSSIAIAFAGSVRPLLHRRLAPQCSRSGGR